MQQERIFHLNQNTTLMKGTVVYWITREFRTHDNYSLIAAQEIASDSQSELIVLINLNEEKSIDYLKPFNFFIDGLADLVNNFKKLNIPVHFVDGNSSLSIPLFLKKVKAKAIVTDFFPLRYYRNLVKKVADSIEIPVLEIDSHNIVPVRTASEKLEFAAYTIRPKINRLLPKYVIEIQKPSSHKFNNNDTFSKCNNQFKSIVANYSDENSIDWLKSGENAAQKHLEMFIHFRLEKYSIDRNNPALRGISDLSPYIHFGQISTQRIALEIQKIDCSIDSKNSFLEEMIVRRELSENYCHYNPNYDNLDGAHQWAKTSLNEHRSDKREFIYSLEQFETAKTHDPAWNAAQREMILTGKMHGYMRMYWAKKILEWTNNPDEAINIAIYLNDKYELDGYDPNGYVGVMWSICGVHDRAWSERPVFGKIRFMNYSGLKRKIDIGSYEKKWLNQSLF